jgi:minor histocompatibility antigen H13
LIAFVEAVAILRFYSNGKHWAMNNLLGISFCLQGVSKLSLGTYKIAAILLAGLFIYDIYWVFGTDVMLAVAKNLDGPIKIMFPRSLVPNAETGKLELSLLGLGDIAIPGFFLLRFDTYIAKIPTNKLNIHTS